MTFVCVERDVVVSGSLSVGCGRLSGGVGDMGKSGRWVGEMGGNVKTMTKVGIELLLCPFSYHSSAMVAKRVHTVKSTSFTEELVVKREKVKSTLSGQFLD